MTRAALASSQPALHLFPKDPTGTLSQVPDSPPSGRGSPPRASKVSLAFQGLDALLNKAVFGFQKQNKQQTLLSQPLLPTPGCSRGNSHAEPKNVKKFRKPTGWKQATHRPARSRDL